MVDRIEALIYAEICKNDGIKAKDLASRIGICRREVNRFLYGSPFMKDLCYQDGDFRWHGQIRQTYPHVGLREFCGYYGTVTEFLGMPEEEWMDRMSVGCSGIGRNLNDTRGLLHSFKDCRRTMIALFDDLCEVDVNDWEIIFELRIRRSKMIRIYADVLVITPGKAFSLEFKMKDAAVPEEIAQAAKYTEYLEVILGPDIDVIPCLVLTQASELYEYFPLGDSSAELPVVSGDMLFNLFDEYLEFLKR